MALCSILSTTRTSRINSEAAILISSVFHNVHVGAKRSTFSKLTHVHNTRGRWRRPGINTALVWMPAVYYQESALSKNKKVINKQIKMSLLPYFYDIERPIRLMERDFFRPENFFGYSPYNQLMPRDFFGPSFLKPWENVFRPWENFMKPIEQLSSAMNQLALNEVGKITSDDEKFQVNVDVQHFSPAEINVKVVDGHVIVEGKHEEKRDEHGYVSRQFVRRYALPQGCLPDTVESRLSSDGVLTVTAPKVLALPSTGEKIVPITHTGPIKKQIGSPEPITEEAE
ncbi:alpha-crystallin B chain [Helicoverpa armigera]|uniref:alpha-crystallin B chain n=1 Tax=Helicoverpa armigera TaxID=29058 RepID=UPI0030827E8B